MDVEGNSDAEAPVREEETWRGDGDSKGAPRFLLVPTRPAPPPLPPGTRHRDDSPPSLDAGGGVGVRTINVSGAWGGGAHVRSGDRACGVGQGAATVSMGVGQGAATVSMGVAWLCAVTTPGKLSHTADAVSSSTAGTLTAAELVGSRSRSRSLGEDASVGGNATSTDSAERTSCEAVSCWVSFVESRRGVCGAMTVSSLSTQLSAGAGSLDAGSRDGSQTGCCCCCCCADWIAAGVMLLTLSGRVVSSASAERLGTATLLVGADVVATVGALGTTKGVGLVVSTVRGEHNAAHVCHCRSNVSRSTTGSWMTWRTTTTKTQ